jgi:hypothetical protein
MLVEELGLKLGKGDVVKIEFNIQLGDGDWYNRTSDKFGNTLTYNSTGYLQEYTRDELGNELSCKSSDGYWSETKRDEFGNKLTHKDSRGFWCEITRDEFGNQLSYKSSYTNTDKK